MSENRVDWWYHVNTGHGSFAVMKQEAAREHDRGARGAKLSVNVKAGGAEALIKVATENGTWSPGWESAPFVIHKYTIADHHEALAMVKAPNWEPL